MAKTTRKEPRADKKAMAARFAAMLEQKWRFRSQQYRLRTILRLSVESFAKAVSSKQAFHPFLLHARDACL